MENLGYDGGTDTDIHVVKAKSTTSDEIRSKESIQEEW